MAKRSSRKSRSISPVLLTLGSLMLASCGGGGSGGSDTGSAPAAPAAAAAGTIAGVAATGAAYAGGSINVTDATGASVCDASRSSLVADQGGAYVCVLSSAAKGPFVVVVSDPDRLRGPQVALITDTPAANATSTANVTPLTTALAAIASGRRSLAELIGDAAAVRSLAATSPADLRAALAALKAQVATLLAEAGVDAASFDPTTTPIVAGSGKGADRVLDSVRISEVPYDDGSGTPRMALMLSTPLAPDTAAIPLADKSAASPAALPQPTLSGADLQAGTAIAKQLQACFSHPVSERALSVDNSIPLNQGGPEVSRRHADCDAVPIETDFINSGYRAWQYFSATMTSDDMTGARFVAPELLRYVSLQSGDVAAANFKYVDKTGAAGNFILNIRKQAGGGWALSTNSRSVEISVRPVIRRSEEFVAAPEAGVFWFSGTSRYQTGLSFSISRVGPGSANLRAVRVKGYGLPASGIVLAAPLASLCSNQTWLDIVNKTGDVSAAGLTSALVQSGSTFWLQRTAGVQGTSATQVRANPFAGDLSRANRIPSWSHPADLGAPAGSTSYLDFTKLGAWSQYTFELFYNDETTPSKTVTARTVVPVIPATSASAMAWHAVGDATRAFLDPASPAAAATATTTPDWVTNPSAEPAASVAVYGYRFSSIGDPSTGLPPPLLDGVIAGSTTVPHGASSVSVSVPGTASGANCAGARFHALTNDGLSQRQVQLRYRMLDGSQRDSMFRFN